MDAVPVDPIADPQGWRIGGDFDLIDDDIIIRKGEVPKHFPMDFITYIKSLSPYISQYYKHINFTPDREKDKSPCQQQEPHYTQELLKTI